jgi:acetoin utilization deacetylase AcuC-like enzyme
MQMPEKTIITFHEKFKQYDLGKAHPFRGDRFTSSMTFFKEHGLLSFPEVTIIDPQPATFEDILRVHDMDYVDHVLHLAKENKPYDVETPVSEEILEAALLIAGGAIKCGEMVYTGNATRGISLGGGYHHAGRSYGGGFCLFNDIAVLVEYLRAKCGAKRFLVVDYDVHFGNGTSDIYYEDDSVLYVSLHQDPVSFYPETGFVWQIGKGNGKGYNVNVPLPAGTGDDTYLYALNEVFVPLAEEFKPEIIIGNGGSDAHFADALGGLRLTAKGFFEVSRLISKTAESTCNGKLVLLIGSGYNPKVLPLCWYALIAGAAGTSEINVKEPYVATQELPYCRRIVDKTLDELKRLLREHWSCFGGFSLNTVP